MPVGTDTSKPSSACTCFFGATCAGVKLESAGAQPLASDSATAPSKPINGPEAVASLGPSPDKPPTIHGFCSGSIRCAEAAYLRFLGARFGCEVVCEILHFED